MARPSRTGGVIAVGRHRIRYDFTIDDRRFRVTKPIVPTEKNLERERHHLAWMREDMTEGTFRFSEEFPEYAARHSGRIPVSAQTCADVFDAFLRHEEARVAQDELTQATVEGHRQILNRWWRPHVGHVLFKEIKASTLDEIADRQGWSKKTYNNAIGAIKGAFQFGARDYPERQNPAAALNYAKVAKRRIDPFSIQDAEHLIAALHADWGEAEGNLHELRFFTGLRPCEEIALLAHDYDRPNGVLNINKTRVEGRDRYSPKGGKDRRVNLCPRAIAVLERQLRLRAQMVTRGFADHEALFFTDTGAPIRGLAVICKRWMRTLSRLPIRYRCPYVARHTSVSWNLMIGEPPLWVAKQHGHSPITMLTVYAAWVKDGQPHDVTAIRRAMSSTIPSAARQS